MPADSWAPWHDINSNCPCLLRQYGQQLLHATYAQPSLFRECSKKFFPSFTWFSHSGPFALNTKNKTFLSHKGKIIFQLIFSHLLPFLSLPSQSLNSFSHSITMEPEIYGKRYKKVATKYATNHVVYLTKRLMLRKHSSTVKHLGASPINFMVWESYRREASSLMFKMTT